MPTATSNGTPYPGPTPTPEPAPYLGPVGSVTLTPTPLMDWPTLILMTAIVVLTLGASVAVSSLLIRRELRLMIAEFAESQGKE
jgi:hypothetical protein